MRNLIRVEVEKIRLLEERVLEDSAAVVGKVIRTPWITGYDEWGSSQDVYSEKGFLVRVLPTDRDSLFHWIDEWLDPYWDVEVLDPDVPIRSCWMFGHSYSLNKEYEPTVYWEVEHVDV